LASAIGILNLATLALVLFGKNTAGKAPETKTPALDAAASRHSVLLLLLTALVFSQINGLGGAKFTIYGRLSIKALPYSVIVMVILPLLGVLYTRKARLFMRPGLQAAAVFFMLAPCAVRLIETPLLFFTLRIMILLVFFTLFSAIPLMARRFPFPPWLFYFVAGFCYFARFLAIFSAEAARMLRLSPAISDLCATILGMVFFALVFRLYNPTPASITEIEARPHADNDAQKARRMSLYAQYGLTERECEIAELARTRLTRKEIAERILRSEATVKKYLGEIYDKVDVSNRRDLVKKLSTDE
jgi:DNA-binding CsgD family transcriptional regulator